MEVYCKDGNLIILSETHDRIISAAALFLFAWDRLGPVCVGWRLQIDRPVPISIRGCRQVSSQVLQVQLFGQLLVKLVNPCAIFS